MELSDVTKQYNVSLTRAERNLVSQLSTGSSASSGDRYTEQVKALADARAVAARQPGRQASERQRRAEKAVILKERLKMLRQMIPFLSPSAAKSLMNEMKQISSQIASLGNGSGGGSGSAPSTAVTEATEAPESGSETGTTEDTVPPGETEQVDDGTPQEEQASSESTLQQSGLKKTDENSEERQLKETVEELKAIYKTVLAALKRKQQQAGQKGEQHGGHASPLQVYASIPENTSRVKIKV